MLIMKMLLMRGSCDVRGGPLRAGRSDGGSLNHADSQDSLLRYTAPGTYNLEEVSLEIVPEMRWEWNICVRDDAQKAVVLVTYLLTTRADTLLSLLIIIFPSIGNSIMRSPSVLLPIIGCIIVLFPGAAIARTAPLYVYRDPPTSSPTSTPSYQPSARPSLEQTSYLRTAYGEPSSGFWLIIGLISALLAAVVVASLLVRKKRKTSPPEAETEAEEERSGWPAWLPSFWSGDSQRHKVDQQRKGWLRLRNGEDRFRTVVRWRDVV